MATLFNHSVDGMPPGAVYIGRPGPFGNPFVIGEHGDRAEVLGRYEAWLATQPALVERIRRELPGKDLVCWCAPLPCHGNIILRLLDEA